MDRRRTFKSSNLVKGLTTWPLRERETTNKGQGRFILTVEPYKLHSEQTDRGDEF